MEIWDCVTALWTELGRVSAPGADFWESESPADISPETGRAPSLCNNNNNDKNNTQNYSQQQNGQNSRGSCKWDYLILHIIFTESRDQYTI